MKNLIVLLSFLFLTTAVNAQAKINFSKTTVDYGNIVQGSDGQQVYNFTNSGNQDLIINKVSSTSTALDVSSQQDTIAPGKSGEIKINYDTSKKGPIRRTVTVYSNAKNTPIVALKVKGQVVPKK